jgi:hypothetical protein
MSRESRQTPEQLSLNRPIKAPAQLLVEGRVPEMFFRELVKVAGLEAAMEVRTFGDINKDNLQTFLELFCTKAAFKETVRALGIVRDAEAKPAAAAFQSVQAALHASGHPVPASIGQVEGGDLRVGVFILPNCSDAGMLETLCLQAASENDEAEAVFPCVDEFFACLSQQGKVPDNLTKAQFAGYALARDVLDPQLGRAAQQGAIPWEAPAFAPLKRFLNDLATQPSATPGP